MVTRTVGSAASAPRSAPTRSSGRSGGALRPSS